MQMPKLVVAAAIFIGAAACSDVTEHTIGMRVDGVKVDCAQQSDGVSVCTPVDGDTCGAATVLWPPNHKMIRFTLADCAVDPGCGGGDEGGGVILRTAPPAPPSVTHITSITADEAIDVGAGGDGHTTVNDIALIDAVTFELRSERQGGGDGRVYRVNSVDDMGVTGSCEFQVPHNQGPTSGALDSGTVVTVTP
jgi:hypothetical protein